MKALVLAAGYGERLRPITDTIPKPLVEIGGRPLIHYPLLLLRHAGIRDVAVNVHHLADKIEAALGGGQALGLAITYSPEPVLLGTGGPLLALRDYFRGERFLLLNGDTIMDLDLPADAPADRSYARQIRRLSGCVTCGTGGRIDTADVLRRDDLRAGSARYHAGGAAVQPDNRYASTDGVTGLAALRSRPEGFFSDGR